MLILAQREAHGAVTVAMDKIHLHTTTNIRDAWYLIGGKSQVPLDLARHRITMLGSQAGILSYSSFMIKQTKTVIWIL